MIGKFVLSRELLSHEIWLEEKFTRGQAWIDLIGLAQWQPGMIRVRGLKIDLKRGDVGWSQRSLMERWQRSQKWVDNFLLELRDDGRISLRVMQRIFTVVSIKNYDLYQDINAQSNAQSNAQNNHRVMTNNKDNKDNNNHIGDYIQKYNDLFGSHSQVTAGRKLKYSARLKVFTHEQIMQALHNLSENKFARGDSSSGWVADADYLIRSDENVDKYLNQVKAITKPVNIMDALANKINEGRSL